MPHVNEQILDHAIKTGDFRYLADWAEEHELPVLAKVLRGHYKNQQIPAMPDYLPHENGLTPKESYEHIKKSPELVPGVHMVPGHDVVPGNKTIGYWLHDLRGFEYPKEDEGMLENGLDDEEHADRTERLREELEGNTPSHYFHSSNRKNLGTEDNPQYIQKRDKLDLAKPIPVYEDPGDEVHITGLSKGGNCEHCGKPDIYRIHVKHPVSGETCKIGSSCASGMLRDNSKKNLTGKMQPKDILHKAATAESLKDVGSVVKVRLKNKDTKLTKAPPDTKETLAREEELEHEPLKSLYHQGVHEGDNFALHILSDQLEERGHPLLATIFRRGAAYREKYGTDHNDKYQTAKQYVSEGDDILRTTQEKRRVGTQGMFTEGFGPHYPWLTILTPHKKNPKYKDVGLRVPLRASEMREYGEKYGHWSTGDGEKAKDAKVEDAPESLELSRGISVEPDTHSQEEIYAALIAEGVDEAKAQELSHALS